MFGLFGHMGKAEAASAEPSALSILQARDDVLYAPIAGKIEDLEQVPDPAFSSGILGRGVAIEPVGSCVYAPVGGIVEALFPTGHAIGISARNGVNVMIHIGIDTVKLEGKGFKPLVSAGDTVRAGDPLIKIDLRTIRRYYPATVMVVVENAADFSFVWFASGSVKPGDPLIEMGDVR